MLAELMKALLLQYGAGHLFIKRPLNQVIKLDPYHVSQYCSLVVHVPIFSNKVTITTNQLPYVEPGVAPNQHSALQND